MIFSRGEFVKKSNNSEIDSTLFITLLKALTFKITVLVGYPSKKFIRFIFPFPISIPWITLDLRALRSSVIQGIDIGNGKINLINFFEGYPTKTVILNVNALSKVMNKVESISELLDFFTNSPLEKIKTN